MSQSIKRTYAFIDAANIIYGTITPNGEKRKLDFQKLYGYLEERYGAQDIFYFGDSDRNNLKQAQFYRLLQRIGYITVLKPTKRFTQPNGQFVTKANCDVDLTLYVLTTIDNYDDMILLSGDGDCK